MPAIQVAKSDTFETQRQKINQIGADIFQVTAGGTDLSTGNLKLGDGTRQSPSLAFTTCLLYTSPSPRDDELSRMPSSA